MEHLAREIGITPAGIKYPLKMLRDREEIRKIGPDKGGRWEAIS